MAIPTQNTYINLDMQESPPPLEELAIQKGSKQDSRLQPSLQQQQEQGDPIRKVTKNNDNNIVGKEVSKGHAVTGIDSMLPPPKPLETVIDVDEAAPDVIGTGTSIKDQSLSKDQQGKLLPDDYGELNFEDEEDPDDQSMDESEEDADDTMKKTGPVFGSNLQEKCSDVQRMTEEQGLSLRGRKQTRHIPHQTITNMSENSSRRMTRSINTKGALERLQTLKKTHNLSIIAILEPFADQSHIATVKLQLQMDQAVSNPNGKFWFFWSTDVTGKVLEKHDQHITVTFQHTALPDKFMMSFVYAKCKEYMRRSLWDKLLIYANMDLPWCTIGDFNVITSIEEKLSGIPYNMNKSLEFIGVIEACGLIDLGYTGLPYTWCNQMDAEARVWKRLDRSMVNDKWLENLPQTTIENLSSVGSDHSPLLMEMIQTNQSHTKYFKFLHCWVENGNFMSIVQQCWDQVTTRDPMWKLHMKMKRLTSILSKWSKQEYGDIFTKVREFEESIRKSEEEFMTNNTEALRQKLHQMNATYIRYLKLEEAILQQKTQLQWFQEGDANTKYFHTFML
ncbi:hypothetical protein H5410_065010 [Solanum commersonii]|uniref:Uncharacterized protein n=1 Tax=Solanum commersonii TaxID=4109 RepID=A0A9J5VYC4_SOLCO|nr:hypothetical protein H5410_065010 [Solanum commersonii]